MLTPALLNNIYAAIGAAVWHMQFMEDVLVTCVTMRTKLTRGMALRDAHQILAQERRKTLGAMLRDAEQAGILGSVVGEAFEVLKERNWLIHRSMHEVNDHLYDDSVRDAFIERVRTLTDRSIELKSLLYQDTSAWCRAQGIDIDKLEAEALEQFRRIRDA